ncbi:MAG: prolyl oligopeptidase family serine peptidase [Halolamina sp.]
MPTSLTIDDVLDIEYPGPPAWAATGDFVAAPVYEDDQQSLRVGAVDRDGPGGDGEDPWRLAPEDGVAEMAWGPEADPDHLAVLTGEGELLLANARNRTTEQLSGDVDADDIAWTADGRLLAVYREGQPTVFDLETGTDRRYETPERGPFLGGDRMLAFSPDGERLAYRFVASDATQIGVLDVAEQSSAGNQNASRSDDVESGDRVWRSSGPSATNSPAWLGDGRLLLDSSGDSGRFREVFAVDPDTGERQTLFREEEETGTVSRGDAEVSPDGERIALPLPLDGWEHVHVIDVDSGQRTQLTAGAFEDKGVAGSSPQWLDDETLVFASNRQDLGERGLFAVSGATGGDPEVTELVTGGTNIHPKPAPDGEHLAYIHASREQSPELRVVPLDDDGSGSPRRITESAVDDWPVDPLEPERISYESVGNLQIEGYLLDPRDSEAVDDDAAALPAVIWVHGGPMRQMRDGWHPSRSYGLAYSFQQYLAQKGYVGLFVNYRGGIGYGRAFREALFGNRGTDEMTDIARGADYLRDLEYVDDDAVGMWGLSYGGYAALQLLGTRPEAFDVAVNIAGLADLEQYRDWAEETKYPGAASSQAVRLGGEPWEAPENWADASPKTHFENYENPLYSFHGTGDRYVDFEQLDVVVEELMELGKDHEWEYYPGENHLFSERATWERALPEIEAAFETELR